MEMFNYGNFIKKIVEKAYLEMTRKYNLTNNEIAVVSYLSISEKDTASDIVNELLFSKSHTLTFHPLSLLSVFCTFYNHRFLHSPLS